MAKMSGYEAELREDWECGVDRAFLSVYGGDYDPFNIPVCGESITPISKLTNLQKRDKEPPF